MSYLLRWLYPTCLLTGTRFMEYPLMYANLFDCLELGSFDHLPDWGNAD